MSSNTTSNSRRWLPAWVGGIAAVAAVLPIGLCPACWPAYLSIASSLGLGTLAGKGLLGPLGWVLIALAVIPLGRYLWQRRDWEAGLAAAVGTVLILEARYLGDAPKVGILGAFILCFSAACAAARKKPNPEPQPQLIQLQVRR